MTGGARPVDGEWSLAAVHDVVAATVPDREMLVCGGVRRTFAQVAERSKGLASFLQYRGLGLRAERRDLSRWESGQDAVALLMWNSAEYIETMYGAFRARATPFNVNQHYTPAEIGSLLDQLSTRAVVYHLGLGPALAQAGVADDVVLVHVDDHSDVDPLPASVPFEEAVATPVGELAEPSPDDLYVVCTGGTTGRPKAVLWRQGDIYIAGMRGEEGFSADTIGEMTGFGADMRWCPVAPLMHAAAQWTAFSAIHLGATVVLRNDAVPFDADAVLQLVDDESLTLISLVGDAHARPIVEAFQSGDYDLSSLQILATGGAATSESLKTAFLDRIPGLTIAEGYGASETGGMAFNSRTQDHDIGGFEPGPGAEILSADRTRILEPGDDEIGWMARRGRVPLGYLGDRDRTESSFPEIDGSRYSIPGDRARRRTDGVFEMLGRESTVINTGGEKVFAEEVEQVLRELPHVADAVVVGRPSERFGHEVVAIVQPVDDAPVDGPGLRDDVGRQIARFKAPRALYVCALLRRHANGKPDYAWAASVAREAIDITTAPIADGGRG